MKIKEAVTQSNLQRMIFFVNKINKPLKFIFLFVLLFVLLQICLIFPIYNLHNTKTRALISLKFYQKTFFLFHLPSILKYHIKGTTTDIEKINISIKHLNFQHLAYERQNALEGKIVKTSRDYGMAGFTYVPASIKYKNKSYPIKIRLKGDRKLHYEDANKWSFRVKLKGNNTLFGMKIFSIHKPVTKNYIHEWIYHKALEREDILSLRYNFINVSVNGKNLGVYALEEHFDKLLLENRKRKNGPILRFNEDFGDIFSISPIEPFRKAQWSTPENLPQLQQAVNLLELFRRGRLKVSDVFETKKLATFFALSDLLGTHHSTVWKSMRFYYNPITSKLEPIGFDGHRGEPEPYPGFIISTQLGISPESTWFYTSYGEWFRHIFNNPNTLDKEFLEEYFKALDRVTKKSYLDNFFREIDDELNQNLFIIHKDFPLWADHVFSTGLDLFYFLKEEYYVTQNRIRGKIDTPEQLLHAYYGGESNGEVWLKISNIRSSLPIEILKLTRNESDYFYPKSETIFLPAKVRRDPISVPIYAKVPFVLPKDYTWSEPADSTLIVSYRFLGQTNIRTVAVHPWSHLESGFEKENLLRTKANFQEFEFIKLDRSEKIIMIKPGSWRLTSNLIIPKGYLVKAGEGTRLNLSNRASIITYSPVSFSGSKERPVVISSDDGSGQGLLVINADGSSTLNNTIFTNLSYPSSGNWSLTGSVTFYKSDVDIKNSIFKGSRSEDGLNIIHSDFSIESSKFSATIADALDVDFSNGSISNTEFQKIGNDAIDISGGAVKMSGVDISVVGDKGISLGERNKSSARDINIENAAIAVAVKDDSVFTLSRLVVSKSQVGITVFQKKSEFGPGSIVAKDISISGTEIPYLVENGSSLTVDQKKIAANRENVKDILYGAIYGKRSK